MMSRPARSWSRMASRVASSCASCSHSGATRHSSIARTRGGKALGELGTVRAASPAGHREPTRLVGRIGSIGVTLRDRKVWFRISTRCGCDLRENLFRKSKPESPMGEAHGPQTGRRQRISLDAGPRPVGAARLRPRAPADDLERRVAGPRPSCPPAAARRCLNTLVQLGYVAKHHRQFLLRPEVMSFASAYLDSMSLGELVRPASAGRARRDRRQLLALGCSRAMTCSISSMSRPTGWSASPPASARATPAYATSMGPRASSPSRPTTVRSHYLATRDLEAVHRAYRDVQDRAQAPSRRNAQDRLCGDPGRARLRPGLAFGSHPLDDRGRSMAAINCSTSTLARGAGGADPHPPAGAAQRRALRRIRAARASPISCARSIRTERRRQNRLVSSKPHETGWPLNRKPPVEYSVLYFSSNRFLDQAVSSQLSVLDADAQG